MNDNGTAAIRTCGYEDIRRPGRFAALVRDLDYPPVTLGRLRIQGEADWLEVFARACPRLSNVEAGRLLGALRGPLENATPGARARREAYEPLLPQARGELADLPGHLLSVGDPAMTALVVTVLARLPAWVQLFVLSDVLVLSVGRESRAWCGSARFVDRQDRDRAHVIVLGPRVDAPIIAHEIAHAVHRTITGPCSRTIPTAGEDGLRALAREEGWLPRLEAHEARHERLADGLACAWLSEDLSA